MLTQLTQQTATKQQDLLQTFKNTNYDLHGLYSPKRSTIETFIAQYFFSAYHARITEFLPLLLTLQHYQQPWAAVGLRPGSCGKLFLEQYLDKPIEQYAAMAKQRPIDRDQIVEIGNLVSAQSGGSQFLFMIMAAALELANYRWTVFTATPQVYKLLCRLDWQPTILEQANPARLGTAVSAWGSYYKTQPKIMLVDSFEAMATLRQNPFSAKVLATWQQDINLLANELRDHRRLCGKV